MSRRLPRNSFTLIELLIVVAIIGILAAIAVPNFLNAQVRAKVARAEADLRSIRTAFEMYRLDNNTYPPTNNDPENWEMLQKPIEYLSFTPLDVFWTEMQMPKTTDRYMQHGGFYMAWHIIWLDGATQAGTGWGGPTIFDRYRSGAKYILLSRGPDGQEEIASQPDAILYDMSNGVNSWGDIIVFGP
jgi:type II secretion system protein G